MLEVAIDADGEWDSSRPWQMLAKRATEAAIAESGYPELADTDRAVEISFALTSDERVRALNAHWRGKDKPTNVLSFPMAEDLDFSRANLDGRELLLGEIIIAQWVCEAEAERDRISFEDHATHLMVHGTLHLLGYDHQSDADAADMEAREVRALARLGIASPYEVTA
jgi:probable rRNA maturation factor